ncbi:ATP-binding protein, partial [Photobacterium damselae]
MPNKRPRRSIRSRLLIAAAVWLSVISLLTGYLVPSFIKSYLIEKEKTQLYLYLDELTGIIELSPSGHLRIQGNLNNPRFDSPYSGLYWTLTLNGKNVRSRSLWDTTITKKKSGYEGPNNQPLIIVQRTLILPESDHPVHLMVAINQDRLVTTIRELTHQVWALLGIMVIGILILITVQISWSLWPLRKLQRNLKEVRAGNINTVTGEYPLEIQPLVDDLNALLFHYQEVLERARNHSGNLSHALKTPIAILNNEVALLEPTQQAKLRPALEQ